MSIFSSYFDGLSKSKLLPNFFCSESYLKAKSCSIMFSVNNGSLIVLDEDDKVFLPPIDVSGKYYPSEVEIDMEGYQPEEGATSYGYYEKPSHYEKEFLDYEFIYNPLEFLQLSGGKWAVFRKNVRRFHKRDDWMYALNVPSEDIYDFWLTWLETQENTFIEDFDVIDRYLWEGEGLTSGLWIKNTMIGCNVWDSNHLYWNYRYCFSLPEIKYANEYLRWRFYTDPVILGSNKLVNDGGSLGQESLEKFKMKLNPIEIRNRYCWRKT